MSELYIEPTEFKKLAYEQVSGSSSDWTKNVLEAFYNQFPTYVNTPVHVEWKKKDDDKGYAIGVIEVESSAKPTSIPIIIDHFKLYPFDVAFIDGTAMPLTELTLQTQTQTRSAFSRAVPRETGDISDALFNPSFSQVIYPNYKVASFIDKIAHTITKEARDGVLNTLKNDPKISEGFRVNKTYDVIEKIASLKGQEPIHIKDEISKDLDRDIHYIYKEGRFNYKAIFGNSKIDDPVELEVTAEIAEKLPHIRTANCGCKQLEKKAEQRKIGVFKVKDRDYSIAIAEHGEYVEIPQHMKLATTKDWTKSDQLEAYADGVFKFGEEVTPPFRILSVVTEKNKTYIDTFNGLEKNAYVKMYGIDTPYKDHGTTYIPVDAQFIKLAKKDAFVADWLEGNYRNRVIKTASGNFTLDGPVFKKYGEYHNIKDLNEHQAKWAMIACSAEQQEVEKLASMHPGQEFTVESCLHAPAAMEKVAHVIEEQHKENAVAAQKLAMNLIKEAATLPDSPTVDAVLSLGFINKDNLLEFVQMIPMYEDVATSLAKLLMAARIGFVAAPEAVVRKTMLGLMDVLQVLYGVKSLATKR